MSGIAVEASPARDSGRNEIRDAVESDYRDY